MPRARRAPVAGWASTPNHDLDAVGAGPASQVYVMKALLALPPAWRAELSLLIGDFNCGIPLFDSQTRTFPCTAWFQRQPWQRLPLRPRPGLTAP